MPSLTLDTTHHNDTVSIQYGHAYNASKQVGEYEHEHKEQSSEHVKSAPLVRPTIINTHHYIQRVPVRSDSETSSIDYAHSSHSAESVLSNTSVSSSELQAQQSVPHILLQPKVVKQRPKPKKFKFDSYDISKSLNTPPTVRNIPHWTSFPEPKDFKLADRHALIDILHRMQQQHIQAQLNTLQRSADTAHIKPRNTDVSLRLNSQYVTPVKPALPARLPSIDAHAQSVPVSPVTQHSRPIVTQTHTTTVYSATRRVVLPTQVTIQSQPTTPTHPALPARIRPTPPNSEQKRAAAPHKSTIYTYNTPEKPARNIQPSLQSTPQLRTEQLVYPQINEARSQPVTPNNRYTSMHSAQQSQTTHKRVRPAVHVDYTIEQQFDAITLNHTGTKRTNLLRKYASSSEQIQTYTAPTTPNNTKSPKSSLSKLFDKIRNMGSNDKRGTL